MSPAVRAIAASLLGVPALLMLSQIQGPATALLVFLIVLAGAIGGR